MFGGGTRISYMWGINSILSYHPFQSTTKYTDVFYLKKKPASFTAHSPDSEREKTVSLLMETPKKCVFCHRMIATTTCCRNAFSPTFAKCLKIATWNACIGLSHLGFIFAILCSVDYIGEHFFCERILCTKHFRTLFFRSLRCLQHRIDATDWMYLIKSGTELFGKGILFCKRKFDFPFESNDSRGVNDKIHLHIEWNWIAHVALNAALHITYVCIKSWLAFFFSFSQTTTSQNARFVNVWIACSVFTSALTVHRTLCALIFVTWIWFWLISIELNGKMRHNEKRKTHQNVCYQRFSDGFPFFSSIFLWLWHFQHGSGIKMLWNMKCKCVSV